jgi:hypothetical protein
VIKARSGNSLIFGLSRMNIERLKQGSPIAIDCAELGHPNLHILIMYGETELAIIHELEGVMNDGQADSLS